MRIESKRDGPTRPVGRPRDPDKETVLSRWLDAEGVSREAFAEKIGILRTNLDRLCRGEREPRIELALKIEEATHGAVPVKAWLKPKADKKKPAPKKAAKRK